jgi:hypothetical protein
MLRVALVVTLLACSGDRDRVEDRPTPKQGESEAPSAERPPPGPPTPAEPTPSGELPADCARYKQLADKLATCEALGPQRDLLKDQFDRSWQAWRELAADAREDAAARCRAAADALEAAAAGPCGW